ncbi:MAG TPA: hypothetical protein VI032_06445 [Burkholderiaceae bacterium]
MVAAAFAHAAAGLAHIDHPLALAPGGVVLERRAFLHLAATLELQHQAAVGVGLALQRRLRGTVFVDALQQALRAPVVAQRTALGALAAAAALAVQRAQPTIVGKREAARLRRGDRGLAAGAGLEHLLAPAHAAHLGRGQARQGAAPLRVGPGVERRILRRRGGGAAQREHAQPAAAPRCGRGKGDSVVHAANLACSARAKRAQV